MDNDKGGPDVGHESTSPPGKRPRAPTITIDTSAVNPSSDMSTNAQPPNESRTEPLRSLNTPQHSPSDSRPDNSFDSHDRPISPHNVSSPNSKLGPAFLEVPGSRARGDSVGSDGAQSTSTAATFVESSSDGVRGAMNGNIEVLSDTEALKPDPGQEAAFEVEDNKFAFSPGQMSKLFNPKSLGAFHAMGGLTGMEKGLRSNRQTGLSQDEEYLDGYVSFEEATTQVASDNLKQNGEVLKNADTIKSQPKTDASEKAYADRKRVFSDNRLPERKSKSILQLAWMAYKDKVLIFLTIAALVSLAVGLFQTFGQPHKKGEAKVEWVEGVAIIVAILIVVCVGAINDWQKERQFVKLNKRKEDRYVKCIRSGRTQEISVYEIFVGDVVLLEPGDVIPVDGIFIEGHNMRCDESSATGESDLLKKTGGEEVWRAMEAGEPLKKLDPFIISGGKVAEGVGKFMVTATGIHSSYGKTMMSLRDDNEVTPLQLKLNILAGYIAKLGGAAAVLLFVVLLIEFLAHLPKDDRETTLKVQSGLNILIVSVTVIVVAVPEGLPLAVTLALAFATTRMLKDNNLVRLLRSCETMGNATTICSDKTGTLTQNKMTVVAGVLGTATRFGERKGATPDGDAESDPDKGKQRLAEGSSDDLSIHEFTNMLHPDVKGLLLQSIAINSTAFEGEEDGKSAWIGSKTETAFLGFARDHLGMGPVAMERANAEVAQLIPFDSCRKCMGAVVRMHNQNTYRMYVKGASEILLGKCSTIINDPTKEVSAIPLSEENREVLSNLISQYASRSLRTIALLYKDFEQWPPKGAKTSPDDPSQADFKDIFKDMTFLGVAGIQDPLRPGVREAVQDCQTAGVFVRMVTGDNVETARAIAEDCGILVPGGLVLEGPMFRKLSKLAMSQAIPKLCVLARSSPEDKRVLVKCLKEMGETVAVTGDGTNDAPALKTADVGFSMGIVGTEVAKEASAIILMDDNFSSIVKALLWGRAVNDAVKKFLQFQVTVNITAVILTFVSAVASRDQSSVLTAVQLLWVNLIMDTFAALALATDPPTRSMLNRKPDPKSGPLITLNMWKMIVGQSIYQLVITFILHFAGSSISGWNKEHMNTVVFNTFVWMQIFNEFNNRRLDNKLNIFEGVTRNWFFIGINCVMVGGQIMIVFVGGRALNVERINGYQWLASIVLGTGSLPMGVIIRFVPDELIRSLIPDRFRRKPTPDIIIDDEDQKFEWNRGVLEIRDDLLFIKKLRGGRLSQLKYTVKHPVNALRSRSASRISSNHSLPQTPTNEQQRRPETEDGLSNSAFGAAVGMAGVVAGSIAGWPSIKHGEGDTDDIR